LAEQRRLSVRVAWHGASRGGLGFTGVHFRQPRRRPWRREISKPAGQCALRSLRTQPAHARKPIQRWRVPGRHLARGRHAFRITRMLVTTHNHASYTQYISYIATCVYSHLLTLTGSLCVLASRATPSAGRDRDARDRRTAGRARLQYDRQSRALASYTYTQYNIS